MSIELVFLKPRQVDFREYKDPAPGPRQVRLRTLYSGISHGTEMNIYRGSSSPVPPCCQRGAICDGDPAYKYPMTYGYEEVGEVTAVGDDVTEPKVGDLVVTAYGRRTTALLDLSRASVYSVVPPGLPPERAIFQALAGVALDAYVSSEIRLGESAVIFGQDVIKM